MTDKRYSLEDSAAPGAPRVPIHNMEQQQQLPTDPTPNTTKSNISRSKTVRNLGSAGSKMRGLFGVGGGKKKEKERRMTTSSTDENGFMTRPILSTSASYGPGSELQAQAQAQSAIKGKIYKRGLIYA
jgi:hypothetical protein